MGSVAGEGLSIPYEWALGESVAFINKAGVARGTVDMVCAELKPGDLRGEKDLQITYRVSVKDSGGAGKHWEEVDQKGVFRTLDEAWKAFESRT